jgi:flagellar hook-length control protein FliK
VAANEAPAARAAVVEPAVVAEQVVRAARLVVAGEATRLRVDLEPPSLGAVRISADARGDALALTITAERPETQALLTQALPDIQRALADRGVGQASVAVLTTPLLADGRRAPDRRPPEPREQRTPTPHAGDRRRAPRSAGPVSVVDVTV